MRKAYISQPIDLKEILFFLVLFACLIYAQSAQSQTPTQLQSIQEQLSEVPNIDQGTIDNLMTGIETGDIDLSELSDLQDMISNLQSGNFSSELVNGLIQNVADGAISPELGQAISAYEQFQNIQNIEDFQEFLENPIVADALEGLINDIEIPEEFAEVVNAITGLVSEVEEAIEGAIEDFAEEIVDALPDELVEALGGDEAVQEAIEEIFGGGSNPETPENPGAADGCGASCNTCKDCPVLINRNHLRIRTHATAEFSQHRNWLVSNFFQDNIAPALALMTSQLTTVGLQQVQIIGSFFDAKHQLETQRLFQTMTAQAHKDYHPSEGLCKIGTNVRSLASSSKKAKLTQSAIASRMMDRQLSSGDGISSQGSAQDRNSRLEQFRTTYCNRTDQAGGLLDLCDGTLSDPSRTNLDINYTRTVASPLTLDFDLLDGQEVTDNQEDIFALASNLFANQTLPTIPAPLLVDRNGEPTDNVNFLLDVRAIAAKRSVAQNSFAAITALKAEGDGEAAPFLKAVLAEAGVDPVDIENRLGENPSYHAQMEVLTKDIYQNPSFYANLYDKPVNVERKSAALLAIELMQDRDIYASLLRSEAVLATLIEVMLEKEHQRISNDIKALNAKAPPFYDFDAGGPQ